MRLSFAAISLSILGLFVAFLPACQKGNPPSSETLVAPQLSKSEENLKNLGLADIRWLDTAVTVKLAYATTDESVPNMFKKNIYEDLKRCFLMPGTANKLAKASANLKLFAKNNSRNLSFLVYDCARPSHIQELMWAILPDANYVARPGKSKHNWATAVDLTIQENGVPLDMGSPFDFFGPAAGRKGEETIDPATGLSKKRVISDAQLANRTLLRNIMSGAGLSGYKNEWWHFNDAGIEGKLIP